MSFNAYDLLWLLLPLAAASGWYVARFDQRRQAKRSLDLPSAYFKGLNFLLNEQPDKAIEVFIQVLEVNSDTVETHLALGNLFRRRGEVERAIRVHQNLIARPTLDKDQRTHALLELGQDYLKAGLLDRAESLFLELAEIRAHSEQALRHLLHIYQQEKEWEKAVKEAKHVVDFLLEHLLRKVTEGRERAIAVEKTLLPLLLLLPSRVEQSHFIKAIADKLGLREQSLWEAFDKLPSPARPAPGNVSEKKSPAPSRPDARERQLFAILFFAESREEKDTRERIRETLTRIMGKERFEEALARYEPLRDMLLLEASVRYGDESVSEKEEQELLHHFEEDELRRQLSEMMHFLTEAERGGDKEKTAALLQKYSEVSQKLGALTSARFLDSA